LHNIIEYAILIDGENRRNALGINGSFFTSVKLRSGVYNVLK